MSISKEHLLEAAVAFHSIMEDATEEGEDTEAGSMWAKEDLSEQEEEEERALAGDAGGCFR